MGYKCRFNENIKSPPKKLGGFLYNKLNKVVILE